MEEEVKEFLKNRGIVPITVDPIPEPKNTIAERYSSTVSKLKKPDFIREKYRPRSCSEDFSYFNGLPSEFTGLPMTIWLDEGATYKASRHNLRIKMNGNYERHEGDRFDIFDVDMNGNIYSCSEENEERYMIEDEDFQAVKNFLKNNEYTIKKIADGDVGYYLIGYYMIKGGEIASEEEKEKLKKMTDYLSWDAGNFEEYAKRYKDRLW